MACYWLTKLAITCANFHPTHQLRHLRTCLKHKNKVNGNFIFMAKVMLDVYLHNKTQFLLIYGCFQIWIHSSCICIYIWHFPHFLTPKWCIAHRHVSDLKQNCLTQIILFHLFTHILLISFLIMLATPGDSASTDMLLTWSAKMLFMVFAMGWVLSWARFSCGAGPNWAGFSYGRGLMRAGFSSIRHTTWYSSFPIAPSLTIYVSTQSRVGAAKHHRQKAYVTAMFGYYIGGYFEKLNTTWISDRLLHNVD